LDRIDKGAYKVILTETVFYNRSSNNIKKDGTNIQKATLLILGNATSEAPMDKGGNNSRNRLIMKHYDEE
jgi:hypothetical protein